MQTPAFFDQVPKILVHDALAQTLGAVRDGLMEYRYIDAVKLAGHSCPTVASAWLMTRAALARLYPEQTPRRGEIRVELCERQEAGVAGVIASVASLVTGAAGSGGFKGLGGRYARRALLVFGVPMHGQNAIRSPRQRPQRRGIAPSGRGATSCSLENADAGGAGDPA